MSANGSVKLTRYRIEENSMTEAVDDLKRLAIDAARQAKRDNSGTCLNPSGFWLWRKARHSWSKWVHEQTATITKHGENPSVRIEYVQSRKCLLCGKVELDRQVV